MKKKLAIYFISVACFTSDTLAFDKIRSLVSNVFAAPVASPKEPLIFACPVELVPHIEKALNEKDFRRAAELRLLYAMRVRMDAVCSNDRSVIAALDYLTISAMTDDRIRELEKHISLDEVVTVGKGFADDLEKGIDLLPGPEWIAPYGMGAFLSPAGGNFVSLEKCRQNRLELLRKYKSSVPK